MKREYNIGTAEDIKFFTGVEIEKTPAFGMRTLFVVGVQDFGAIHTLATAKPRCLVSQTKRFNNN